MDDMEVNLSFGCSSGTVVAKGCAQVCRTILMLV